MIELCEATEENPFIHGMSKQFVAALQQLFDVMDNERLGTIRFSDLANQWEEDDGDPFFPKGLITCLAKVKLPNGLLTFDRFCAGIKLCLLKNQVDINDDIRMMSILNDECRSMATSDSSVTIPNGIDFNENNNCTQSSQQQQQQSIPSLSLNAIDRPSSEPQIFAPPPPSSLSPSSPATNSTNRSETNNTNITNNIIHNSPRSVGTAPQFTPQQLMNSYHSQPMLTTEIPVAKKLPLPSYEQVMAAKSKPKVPPPPISSTSSINNHTNSDQSQTIVSETRQHKKTSSKPTKQFPHLSQQQLEEIKRVVNHQYLESQYGYTGRNRITVSNDNQQQQQPQLWQQKQACRAKSMPHLIDLSPDSPSSKSSFTNADHPNYNQQLSLNGQAHLNHNHNHNLIHQQQNHLINENRKEQQQQQVNNHNMTVNSVISNNNEPSQIIKKTIIDENTAPKTVSRNCIMKTLQNWRDNILSRHQLPSFNDLILHTKNTDADFHKPFSLAIKSSSNQTSNSSIIRHQNKIQLQASPSNNNEQGFLPPSIINNRNYIDNDQSIAMINGFQPPSLHRRSSIRQQKLSREPRRHTVGANGIDLYAVKRFQQLEQEKDILIRGLAEIECTKEWYLRQISIIQDRINNVTRSGVDSSFVASDYNNIDAYQERVNFQAIRIQTLNQHLAALRNAGQNFPIHMNLAIRPLNGYPSSAFISQQSSPQIVLSGHNLDPNQPKQLVVNPNLVNKLKEQNRLLTDEVSRKSERITQLEREKASLIRELFQARTYSSYYNGHFDDTFM